MAWHGMDGGRISFFVIMEPNHPSEDLQVRQNYAYTYSHIMATFRLQACMLIYMI